MSSLEGYEALTRRLAAVNGKAIGRPLMTELGKAAIREAKSLAIPHRKTANLERSIHVTEITDTSVKIVAQQNYAAYLEFGTRPHEITPNAKKALAWSTTAAGRRLSGSMTSAARRGSVGLGGKGGIKLVGTGVHSGPVQFAKRVHHPGTQPAPFLRPGAEKAVKNAKLLDQVVAAWNEAAE